MFKFSFSNTSSTCTIVKFLTEHYSYNQSTTAFLKLELSVSDIDYQQLQKCITETYSSSPIPKYTFYINEFNQLNQHIKQITFFDSEVVLVDFQDISEIIDITLPIILEFKSPKVVFKFTG